MCYYDNFVYQCGDWKWGNFRQHCHNEYRTGETCGLRLAGDTRPLDGKCNLCEKIERKFRRMEKAKDDYHRWNKEPAKYRCSIEKVRGEIQTLKRETEILCAEKDARYKNVGNPKRKS